MWDTIFLGERLGSNNILLILSVLSFRGIAVYSVLYPASNATQQFFDRKKINPFECIRFGILGSLVIAPTLYGWMKLVSVVIKGNTFKHCVIKAVVEQFTWAPYCYFQFYVGINVLEGKPWEESLQELRTKFWPTWKVGVCIWPVVQTLNFRLVPERNRVPFISIISFAWNIFLSYTHSRKQTIDQEILKDS